MDWNELASNGYNQVQNYGERKRESLCEKARNKVQKGC